MKRDIKTVFNFLNYRQSNSDFEKTISFYSIDRSNVRDMIDKLSWKESEDNQKIAIDYLSENLYPHEYIYLVLPDKYYMEKNGAENIYCIDGTDKSRWENAAKTIVKIGWPKVDHIIVPIFIWLLDSNWPGSLVIHNFLLTLPKEVLFSKIKEVVDNPQYYSKYEYEDLLEQFEDLCEDAGIGLEYRGRLETTEIKTGDG